VDTDVLEEHTATFFRVKLNSWRIWPNYIGMVKRSMVMRISGGVRRKNEVSMFLLIVSIHLPHLTVL